MTEEGNDLPPPLPDGIKPLEHQVAGHAFGTGKTKLGFLQCNNGTILKPILGSSEDPKQLQRRRSELDFYQKVYSEECKDAILLAIRNFTPRYLGTWTTPLHPNILYFRLEDITVKFKRPCIVDIKMGCVTYAPDAEPEKIEREKSKYPPARELGYQFIGMRVYDAEKNTFVTHDRKYLRSLSPEELYTKALSAFLRFENHYNKTIVSNFLNRLKALEQWFLHQKKYTFYASSLLLVYEGHIPEAKDVQQSEEEAQLTDIRMIDFPRVFPSEETDLNYLTGLQGLIKLFQRALSENE